MEAQEQGEIGRWRNRNKEKQEDGGIGTIWRNRNQMKEQDQDGEIETIWRNSVKYD